MANLQQLERLLRPKSLAVIGGKWAENVIVQCLQAGFEGALWPIHPTRKTIAGVRCYQNIDSLPTPPDACFIGINRDSAITELTKLSAMGAGGAICFASGFAETGDYNYQEKLLKACASMPMLGPNCYGLINYLDNVLIWPDQHGGNTVDKGVAIISQSSNIAINFTMQQRALPIAYVICTGNQAQLSSSDIAMALLDDERVSAIGFYLEGISAGSFAMLAHKAKRLKKGLVAIKAGKSNTAIEATLSHSASMSGESSASSAFLRQCEIAEVTTPEALIEALKILHCGGDLQDGSLGVLCCSGGESSIFADAALPFTNITLPAIEKHNSQTFKSLLGPMVHISNPLDYHTFIWGDRKQLQKTYTLMMEGNNELTILIMDIPNPSQCNLEDWQPAIDAIIMAQKQTGMRTGVLTMLSESMPLDLAQYFMRHHIIPLTGLSNALEAINALSMARFTSKSHWFPLPNHVATIQKKLLSEAQAKQWLKDRAFPVPEGLLVQNLDMVASAAKQLQGLLAIKAMGLTHKSDLGALELNVSPDQANEAALRIEKKLTDSKKRASGYLVEQMIPSSSIELLIALKRDPIYGICLTIGMGGIHTEIFHDVQTLILPVSPLQIEYAFYQLKCADLFKGYRNIPVIDVSKIANVVYKLAQCVIDDILIHEIEINPLIVCKDNKTIQIADALMWVEEHA